VRFFRRTTSGILSSALALLATSASGSPSARLTYVRGDGAEACPDEAALRKAVADRLGYDPFFPSARKSVVAEIQKTPRGYASRILIVSDSGRSLGERKLPPSGTDCTETVRAVALAISIALDDLEAQEPKPPEPEPAPATTSPSPEPTSNVSVRSPGTGRSTDTSTGPEGTLVTSPKTSGPLFEASAGIHLALGLAPSPALGARVGVALLPPPLRFALEARFDANASESLPEGGRVAAGFAGGSALACFQPGRPQACAVFAIGDYHAEGVGLERTHSASALITLVGARAAFDLPLGGAVFARPLGEIDVPLERHRIVVTDAATGATRSRYRVSPIAGILGVDLGIRF
jgi:hypothetical protein